MKRDLVITRVYDHPIDRVWRAITDSEAIAEWLMANDFEPRVGHRFTFRTDPAPGFDGIVHCEVLEVEEPWKLSYRWTGGPLDTVIAFTLEAVADGTRLTLRHSGFSGLKAVMVSFIMQNGWGKMTEQKLPSLLDRMRATADRIAADGDTNPNDGASGAAADASRCDYHGGNASIGTKVLAHMANIVPGRTKDPSGGDARGGHADGSIDRSAEDPSTPADDEPLRN